MLTWLVQHTYCFEGSLYAVDGGLEGIVHENVQVFNNVFDLYGISRTSSGKGWYKWSSSSSSYVVAFSGIDREVPIYRPIPDIVEAALQKVALWAWWDHLDVIGEKQRQHIDDTREVADKQQEWKWVDHWPLGYPTQGPVGPSR